MKVMRMKIPFAALLIAMPFLSAACASRPTALGESGAPVVETVKPVEDIEAPAQVESSELPAEAAPEEALPLLAVYIDGAGLDAFEALGVLQEFEKSGLNPRFVAGGGFGCWIALSWALENKGSRAEWQAFKWTNWNFIPKAGVLGRLRAIGSRSEFEAEFNRLMTSHARADFAIPVACPLFARDAAPKLAVSSALPDARNFALQMAIPDLGFAPSRDVSEPLSAVVAGIPAPAELDEFTRAMLASGERVFWLVLKTRPGRLGLNGSEGWSDYAKSREIQPATSGHTPSGHGYLVVDIASAAEPPDLLRFELRRNRLLSGRAKAAALKQREELKKFFPPKHP